MIVSWSAFWRWLYLYLVDVLVLVLGSRWWELEGALGLGFTCFYSWGGMELLLLVVTPPFGCETTLSHTKHQTKRKSFGRQAKAEENAVEKEKWEETIYKRKQVWTVGISMPYHPLKSSQTFGRKQTKLQPCHKQGKLSTQYISTSFFCWP